MKKQETKDRAAVAIRAVEQGMKVKALVTRVAGVLALLTVLLVMMEDRKVDKRKVKAATDSLTAATKKVKKAVTRGA